MAPTQPPTRYPQISQHDMPADINWQLQRRHSGLPQRVCLTSKTWKIIGKSYFLLRYYTWQKNVDNTIQTKEHLTPLPCSVHTRNYFLTRNDKIKSSNASYSRKDMRSSMCPVANFVWGARCLLWGVQREGSTANREALQESRLDTDYPADRGFIQPPKEEGETLPRLRAATCSKTLPTYHTSIPQSRVHSSRHWRYKIRHNGKEPETAVRRCVWRIYTKKVSYFRPVFCVSPLHMLRGAPPFTRRRSTAISFLALDEQALWSRWQWRQMWNSDFRLG